MAELWFSCTQKYFFLSVQCSQYNDLPSHEQELNNGTSSWYDKLVTLDFHLHKSVWNYDPCLTFGIFNLLIKISLKDILLVDKVSLSFKVSFSLVSLQYKFPIFVGNIVIRNRNRSLWWVSDMSWVSKKSEKIIQNQEKHVKKWGENSSHPWTILTRRLLHRKDNTKP